MLNTKCIQCIDMILMQDAKLMLKIGQVGTVTRLEIDIDKYINI